jgi:hypothetical protein
MTVISHALESNTVRKIVLWITRAGLSRSRMRTPNSTVRLARAYKLVVKSLAIWKNNSTKYRAIFKILPHQLRFPKDNHFIHNSFINLTQKVVEMGSKFNNFTERFDSLLAHQARHVTLIASLSIGSQQSVVLIHFCSIKSYYYSVPDCIVYARSDHVRIPIVIYAKVGS